MSEVGRTGQLADASAPADAPIIRIAIVEEEPTAADSVAVTLEQQPDLSIVGTGGSGSEAIQLAKDLCPEVMVLELSLPDTSGESATRSIVGAAQRHPAVLAVAGALDEDRAIAAIRAGASGVCTKVDPPEVVAQSVRSVAAGDAAISPPLLRKLLRRLVPPRPAALRACSSREVEVLGLVGGGATNPEIGERLFIAQTTVRSHVQSLRHKLGARNRIDLVVLAHRSGLTGPSHSGLDSTAHPLR